MLRHILCAGLFLLLPSAALAGPATSVRAPNVAIQSLTLDDLRLLLDDLGATFIAAGRNDAGAAFVFGQMPDGLTFGAYTVCGNADGTDCRGLEFMAVFGTDMTVADISRIDRDYAAVSLYKADDGSVHVSRYVILDYGITWANLIENANVFHMLCGKVIDRLEGPSGQQPQ